MTATDSGTALWPISISPSDHPADAAERDAVLADPGFGRTFTDNMVRATWTEGEGWHDARLEAYGPLSLDPATNFMHYGQAIFEGLKAYRHADDSIWAFRPLQNAERFANSARRLAMAEVPPELFLGSIEALVRQDRAWVPSGQERSLYLRPFMVATEVGLGIRPAKDAGERTTWQRVRRLQCIRARRQEKGPRRISPGAKDKTGAPVRG